MATVYLSLLGRVGLRRLAERNLAKAEYAKARVRATPGLTLPFSAPTFNEFAVGVRGDAAAALGRALEAGILGGLDLAPHLPAVPDDESRDGARRGPEEERCLSFHIRHSSTTPAPRATLRRQLYSPDFLLRRASPVPSGAGRARPLDRGKEGMGT
jgi:hypothetical protein